ncbi:hypothetical protein Poli38472_002700 [Pythium oligandrum]|uniref:Uncharacterized protein n=1 Tax=Pythium oligandrum TaxID=41045 RepID=A0A8K1CHN2_PYTOL|nr:hypothetical protein Poli38472_002700 [Pythium oligandrum]|eukprot:TMW63759.1 hypothetical protein Poli38472_002700 [Pythium oligandrum]
MDASSPRENDPETAAMDARADVPVPANVDDSATNAGPHGPPEDQAVQMRLLQALPQLSQWLQGVNTHPGLQRVQRMQSELQRRRSSFEQEGVNDVDDTYNEYAELLRRSSSSGEESSRRRGRQDSASLFEIRIDTGNPSENDVTHPTATQEAPRDNAANPTGSTSPRSNASSDGETSQHEELSTLDELQSIFRRGNHTLPFIALFLVYFAYQHTLGIAVFIMGTVAIMGLDQRLVAQITLKENASRMYLFGIMAMCCLDLLALCTISGDPNPLHHLTSKVQATGDGSDPTGAFWQVLWIITVNDFIIRLFGLALKAFVALIPSEKWVPGCRRSASVANTTTSIDDDHDEDRRKASRATIAFYRRKRKIYSLIEMVSIFTRSFLAGIPWCSFYQLCASKFMADAFTFGYIFTKGFLLGSQGRRIYRVMRSLRNLGLEHAVLRPGMARP